MELRHQNRIFVTDNDRRFVETCLPNLKTLFLFLIINGIGNFLVKSDVRLEREKNLM